MVSGLDLRFGSSVWISDLDFKFRFQVLDFRVRSEARGTKLLRLGEPLGGNWGNQDSLAPVAALEDVV